MLITELHAALIGLDMPSVQKTRIWWEKAKVKAGTVCVGHPGKLSRAWNCSTSPTQLLFDRAAFHSRDRFKKESFVKGKKTPK